MGGHAQQIIIAQKFVTMTGKAGDDLGNAIMDAVIVAQKEIEKAGMNGCTVVVRQVITTGQLQVKATIIMDIMQIVTIASAPLPTDKLK